MADLKFPPPAQKPTAQENTEADVKVSTIDLESHSFVPPTKQVKTPADVEARWLKSLAYQDLLGFIQAMGAKINNTKISDTYSVSQTVLNLVAMLDELSGWLAELPPTDEPQRFGNSRYRDWYDRLQQEADKLLHTALPDVYHSAIPELQGYLLDSFGNRSRIDYGTGHEMTFVAFLLCLYKIGALEEQDACAVVLRIFDRYLKLARELQTTYRMEPAGSQGVWNLDDYQFIAFIWGAAQFVGNHRVKPKSFVDPEICDAYHKDYILLSCIRYINSVKTGPFHEHSNQLWNISGVPLWTKVYGGLIKMYKAEVLCKFPVIQHFLFGSLLTLDPATGT